jgi:VWFA-related protein
MRLKSLGTRLAFAFLLFTIALALGLVPPSTARAQQGVDGDNPVVVTKKQAPNDPDLNKQPASIRVTTNLVTAPVTVVDARGEFVYDLGEGDFKVLDNGVPQRIDRFETEPSPLALVIVIETTDSIAPLLPDVRVVGPLFSSLMLGPQGEAAVVTYGDHVHVVQDFTQNSDRLESALRGLIARGSTTNLSDALARAVTMLEKRPKEERRVIVAFSEGYDIGSETSKDDVVHRATNDEVTIYGVGFSPTKAMLAKTPHAPPSNPLDTNVTRPLPPNTPRTPSNSEAVYEAPIPIVPIILATGEVIRSTLTSSLLEFYAGYTGGVYYSHWSKKAVQEELSKIASEIHSQYELAYIPNTLSQTGFHRIQVEVRRPRVKVRTRAGYFYQGPNP